VAPLGHLIWYLPAPAPSPLVDAVAAVVAAAPASVIVGLTGDAEADEAVLATCARAGIEVPPASEQPPTAARIISTTDADEEVRAVVRAVAELIEAGARLDRIGIFFPAPEPYVAILEQHLEAAGIPANGPSRRRLADSVAGRTLLAALALPAERWRRDRVLALVSGGPLRNGDGSHARPSTWETISRDAGVVGGLDDWRTKLATRQVELEGWAAALGATDVDPDEDRGTTERRVARLRREVTDLVALGDFVSDLAGAVRAVERAASWSTKVEEARNLLHRLLGPGHRHARWPDDEQAAFERVEDALVRLGALDEIEAHPSHAVFLRALTAELDVARGRTRRFGEGVVYGPLASAHGHDLDAVFVVGCVEGLCPAPRREDGLLPDAARLLAPGDLEPRAGRLHDQHRAFLAALAAAPARTLTMARGDLRANREALPSRWLLDSASRLAGEPLYVTDFAERAADLAGVEVVSSFAAGLRHAATYGSVGERDLAALERHRALTGDARGHPVAARVGRALEAQAARRSAELTEWDGNLAGQPIGSTADRPQSPSRLEAWATCGFRYFLRHVLGLADRDDPERVVDIDARDRGTGVHEVLERFVQGALDAGPPDPDLPWSAADRTRLQAIADDVFADLEQRGRTGRTLHWQLAQADLRVLLDRFLDADDRYRAATRSCPAQVELPFGLEGAPPVRIPLPDGRTLQFRGKVDRVDRSEDGRTLVADYKTGRPEKYKDLVDGDPVKGGTTLQLGLYAEAARQLLAAGEVEAWYWMLDGEQQRLGYAWTDARRQRLLDVVTAIVDGIEGGAFPAVPGDWNTWRSTHDSCAWCDFDHVCPQGRGEQAASKVDAPQVRRRAALTWEPTS
jgi:RecB family exonuclease